MKLSISQYNEIFKDRSVTNYTKFNWKGDMPVIRKDKGHFYYKNTTSSTKYQGFDDPYAGIIYNPIKDEKILVQVYINKSVPSGTSVYYPYDLSQHNCLQTNDNIYKDKPITWVSTQASTTPNVACPANSTVEFDYEIIISEYVDNLVLTNQLLNGNVVRNGDDYKGTFTNYEPINASLTSSQLAYGDYLVNCDINELKSSTGYIWVRNNTKNINIFDSGYKGIFTLTPYNYSPGDNISIYLHHNAQGGYLDITNFFVCKIQDVRHSLSSFTFPVYEDACIGFDITDFTPNTDEFRITITDLKFNRAYNFNSVWCYTGDSDANESWLDSSNGLNNRINNDAIRCNIYSIDVNTASTYVFNKLNGGNINVSYQNRFNSATGTALPVVGSLVIGAIPGNTNPEYTFTSVVIQNLTTGNSYTLYPQLYRGKYYLYDTQHDKMYELKHQHE